MTEDDAKTSACIGPRPEMTGQAIPGERSGTVAMYACRGSACKLAWRWAMVPSQGTPDVLVKSDTDGYCALTTGP